MIIMNTKNGFYHNIILFTLNNIISIICMYVLKHNNTIIKYNNGYTVSISDKVNLFFLIRDNTSIKIAHTDKNKNIILTTQGHQYVYVIDHTFFLFKDIVCQFSSFTSFMIVYNKSRKRVHNYIINNKLFNNTLNKFVAFDSIVDNKIFEMLIHKYTSSNIITDRYVKDVIHQYNNHYRFKGKLGVVLSHMNIWKQFISNTKNVNKWLLILEDDISIKDNDITILINNYIHEVESLPKKSLYIKLYIHPTFSKQQFTPKFHIKNNIYHLFKKQWSNVAYIIHYDGIHLLLNNLFPLHTFFDYSISDLQDKLNGVIIKNNIIHTHGAIHGEDRNSRLGSIIFNI
jgi:GR25 family glycosyltransferase involved in LPS biosynthesis